MDGADARAGQHGVGRFGDHRQVDGNPVAASDALRLEHVRHAANVLVQLAIGDVPRRRVRIVGLPDDGGLLAALLQVPVDAVRRDVEGAVLEPFDRHVGKFEAGVFDARVRLDPVEALAFLAPEFLGLGDALLVELLVRALVDEGAVLPFLGDLHRIQFVMLVLGHPSVPPYADATFAAFLKSRPSSVYGGRSRLQECGKSRVCVGRNGRMSEHKHYKLDAVKVPKKWKDRAFIDKGTYQKLYEKSVAKPEKFWGKEGKRLDWIKPYTRVKNTSFEFPNVSIKWFEDGTLNVAANCIDRHLKKRGKKTAIIWEPDDPNTPARHITYRELYENVCRMANVLKAQGVRRGDRVTIYLPMIPEAAYAMLACARIGAVHSIVFGGFSPDSLAGRIEDCKSAFVITADEGLRGGRKIPLKANTDTAIEKSGHVQKVLVVRHTGGNVPWTPGRDVWLDEEMAQAEAKCEPEEMNAEDPLFILYTSGSTGMPKGVLHTTGGYLVFAAMTHQYVFDYHDGDIYWCTADVGWVTGHSYIVYGPLANGATTLMFEGVPNYPDASRFW